MRKMVDELKIEEPCEEKIIARLLNIATDRVQYVIITPLNTFRVRYFTMTFSEIRFLITLFVAKCNNHVGEICVCENSISH